MEYRKEIVLKDGALCLLRNGVGSDAQKAMDNFILTHGETDFLLTYPEESTMDVEREREFLEKQEKSDRAVEIYAFVNGIMTGSAGIEPVGEKMKNRHRAEFGISVEKAHWGRGIGRALTAACIACAKKAGFAQLELDVVAENTAAIALYKSVGFTEYGRNPRGFLKKDGSWQEVILMRLELE